MKTEYKTLYEIYCEVLERGEGVELSTHVEEYGIFSTFSDLILPKGVKCGDPISASNSDYIIEYCERRTSEIEITPLILNNKVIGFILKRRYLCSNPECFVEKTWAYVVTEMPMRFKVRHNPPIDIDCRVFTGYGEKWREPRIFYTEHESIVAPELVEKVRNLIS